MTLFDAIVRVVFGAFRRTFGARRVLLGSTAIALGVSTPALAQTWNGSTDNAWNDGTNWDGGSAPLNDGTADVIIDDSGAVINTIVDLNGSNVTVNSLTFEDDPRNGPNAADEFVGLTNGGTLTFGGASNALTIDTDPGFQDTVTFTNVDLAVAGSSDLTISVSTGLTFATDGGLDLSAGQGVLVNDVGAMLLSGVITGTGAFEVDGATVTLSGTPLDANDFTGDVTLTSGRLILEANVFEDDVLNLIGGTLELRDVAIVEIAQSGASDIELQGGWLGMDVTADSDLSGNIVNTGGSNFGLRKAGSSVLTLSGTNTYSGNTQIVQGELIASGGSAIGDASQVVLTNSGTTLTLQADETIGGLSGETGTVVDVDTFNLTISDMTNAASNTQTFSGSLSGTGVLIMNAGAGDTQVLDGDNSAFGGGFDVQAGTLEIDSTTAMASTQSVILDGGTLDIDATVSISDLSGTLGGDIAGNLDIATGTQLQLANQTGTRNVTGTLSGDGTLALGGAGGTLNFAADNSGFTGTISAASTDTLQISNAFGGDVSLNGGTLQLSNDLAGSVTVDVASTIRVDNGSTYSIDGYAGNADLTVGELGDTGRLVVDGTVTQTGSVSLSAGSIEIGSASAGTNFLSQGFTQVSGTTLDLAGIDTFIGGAITSAGQITSSTAATLTLDTSSAGAAQSIASDIDGSISLEIDDGDITLTGNNTFSGGTITLQAGTLTTTDANSLPAAALVMSGGDLVLGADESMLSLSGAAAGSPNSDINLAANTLTINDLDGGTATSTTYQGTFTGTGTLDYNSVGDRLTLSGDNSGFAGTVDASLGTVRVATSFGGDLAVSGGTMIVDTDAAFTGAIDLASGELLVSQDIDGTISATTGAALITMNSTHSISALNSTQNLTFGSATSNGTLIVDAAGLSLSHTGTSTIDHGTLQIGSMDAGSNLLAGGLTINANGTLDIGGFATTAAALSGAGDIDNSGAATTFTLNTAGADTFDGDMLAGVQFVKTGAGSVTINGSISQSADIAQGAMTIGNGGSANSVNVQGTLNVDNGGLADGVTVQAGATVNNAGGVVDLSMNAAGIVNNQANGDLSGTLTLGAGTLNNALDGTISGAVNMAAASTHILNNDGQITGAVTMESGTLNNAATGLIRTGVLTVNGGVLNNDGEVRSLTTVDGGTINNEGTFTQGLTVDSGILNNNGLGVLGNVNVSGTFNNLGGQVGGTVRVLDGGSFEASSGTISGETRVEEGGSATASGATFGDIQTTAETGGIAAGIFTATAATTINGNVTNSGTFAMAADVTLNGDFENNGLLTNNASASDFLLNLGTNIFTNAGLVAADGAGTLTVSAQAITLDTGSDTSGNVVFDTTQLTNIGTITVDGSLGGMETFNNNGTLNIGENSSVNPSGNTFINTGIVNMANNSAINDAGAIRNLSGAVINVNGNAALNADTSATGFAVSNQGTIQTAGTGVTLTIGDAVGTHTLSNYGGGEIIVNAGDTLTGTGLTIRNGDTPATFTVANGASVVADVFDLRNQGELVLNGGTVTLGALNTFAGSTLTNNSSTVAQAFTSNGTVNNTGTFTGAIDVAGGTFTNNAGGDLAGVMTVSGGTLASVDGTITGSVDVTGGTFAFSGGTLSNATDVSAGTMEVSAGTVTTQVNVTGSGALDISGGTVDLAAMTGGTTTVSGGTLTLLQQSGGTLTVDTNGTVTTLDALGGVSNNGGTVTTANVGVGGDYRATDLTTTLNGNGGRIRLQSGSTTTTFNNASSDDAVILAGGAVSTLNSTGATANTINRGTITAVSASDGRVLNQGTVNGASITGGRFINSTGGTTDGDVTMSSGNLRLADGEISGDVAMSGGNYLISGGLASGLTTITGGNVDVTGGVLSSATDLQAGTMEISGGTLSGTLQNSGGTLTLSSGSLNGLITSIGGTTSIEAAATVDAFAENGGTTTNDGSINVLTMDGLGTLTNNAGGTITTATITAATLDTYGAVGSVTIDGADGTLNVFSGGSVDNLNMTDGEARISTGGTVDTAELNGGQLSLDGDILTEVVLNAGTLNQDTTSNIASVVQNGGDMALNGATTVLEMNDGTATLAGTVSGDATFNGGTATNTGTLNTTVVAAGGNLTSSGQINGPTTVSGVVINDGALNDTVDVQSGGDLTNNGSVSAQLVLHNGGAATNSGDLDTVDNLGAFAMTGGTAVTLTNSGTGAADLSGGTISDVQNTAQVTVSGDAAAQITNGNGGAVTVDAGATLTGDVTNDSGASVDLAGAIDGEVNISDGVTFNVTDGGAVARLIIDTDFTLSNQLSLLNNGTASLAAGSTLTLSGGGLLGGTLTNMGTLSVDGSGTLGGLDNGAGSVLSMQDGATDDTLSVTGDADFDSSSSVLMDIDLETGTSDTIEVSGSLDGTLNLSLNDIGGTLSNFETPLELVTYSGGSPTVSASGLPTEGEILYTLVNDTADGTVTVNSILNPAIGGIASGVAVTQSLISSIVNRPSSPFISGLASGDDDPCGVGAWARGVGGAAKAVGGTVVNAAEFNSEVGATFGGVQVGADYSCFNGYFNGWDLSFGLIGGYNFGVTSQPVYDFDPNSGAFDTSSLTATTNTRFRQVYGGGYIGFAKDRFFADLQYRYDRTTFDLTHVVEPGKTGIGVLDQTYQSTGHTVSGSASYAFSINPDKGLNFIPTAGFSFGNLSSDPIQFNNAYMEIDNIKSRILFGGATISRSKVLPSGTAAVNYFATATAYLDVAPDTRVTYYENLDVNGNPLDDGITAYSSSVGFYGELSLGASYTKLLDPGRAIPGRQFDASVRVDGRLSSTVQSAGITVQVRLSF